MRDLDVALISDCTLILSQHILLIMRTRKVADTFQSQKMYVDGEIDTG